MRAVHVAALGLLVLTIGACDLTSIEVVPSDDVVVAELYLRPAASQKAFLYRTLPGRDGSLRVDGAAIEVTDGAGSRLTFEPASSSEPCAEYTALPDGEAGSCYVSEPSTGFVRPGETYRLALETADGRRLEGSTTVPGDFAFRRPAADTCVLENGLLELVWTASDEAWSYQAVAEFTGLAAGLVARGVTDPPDTLELLGLSIGRADTTIVFPSEFGVFDRFALDRDVAVALQQGLPEGAAAEILVAAGDRNFVNWVRGGNFNPSGQVRIPSVVGDGTGVFASLMVRRRTVRTDGTDYGTCQ